MLVSVEKIIGVIEKQSIICLVRYKLCMRNRYGASCVTFTNKTETFCILVICCVLFDKYTLIISHMYASFVESKTICLRYIACVVTALSMHHCSMPLDTPN